MQSPSYISSSPSSSSSSDALHHVHLPWKSRSTFPKFKFKTKISCNSLIASYGHGFERIQSGEKPPGKEKLRVSVVISKSGKATRYIWDGTHLLECFDGDSSWSSSNNFNFDDGVRRLYELCKLGIWDFFIPHQVQANYIQYVKWKLLHRVFSSALQVLATQAMFRAMGVGYSRSLTSAAALNWVLKDGLGRLSRCIYTASLASAFDTNLKRVRFSTSVVFSLSMGVELLTPYFPHYFLLLASVANIAKQISLACYLATGSAVHRSFAVADNLGEISAKAQIQTVCFDNLGLMLAALLNILCKNDLRLQAGLPFIVYPMFSGIDLLGIYQGLKHVHLQTLTKERLEIILDVWIQSGIIPSPAEVSKEEGIDFPWTKCRKQWPIKIGCADPKDLLPKFSMLTICSLSNEDFYFIRMETSIRGLARNGQGYIRLCLREGASTTDIIMGLLQACYIRKALLDRKKWEYGVEANDESESVHGAWLKLVEDSKRRSHEKVNLLKEQLQESGWAIKNILLSAEEKARYSLPDN